MDRASLLNLEPDLPEAYLSFMENYPPVLRDTGDTAKFELLDDIFELEEANEQIKNIDTLCEDDYFCIGTSGCGDYYLIDIAEADPEVVFWNHEIDEIETSDDYSSIEQFAGHILASKRQVQEIINSENRPWWKLW